jgi:hypothetical protein
MTKWDSVSFSAPTAKGKRLKAVFRNKEGRKKTVQFGSATGSSFLDHKDEKVKDAWIARHRVREDWTVPDNAGSLSKHILWETTSLAKNKRLFAKKFSLKMT